MSILRKIECQCLYVFLLTLSTYLSAQIPTSEYQVKAVFLFNFTQFVEWPADSFYSAQAPLVIGILGDNPFGSYLEELAAGEKVNEHPLIIQYYKKVEDIQTCHVLFINLYETGGQEEVVESLKGRNILTVTNGSDFFKQEEVIRFFIKNNKIQFQINTEAAKEANLVISSKLLRLALIAHKKSY